MSAAARKKDNSAAPSKKASPAASRRGSVSLGKKDDVSLLKESPSVKKEMSNASKLNSDNASLKTSKSRVNLDSISSYVGGRQSVAWRSSGKGFKVPRYQNTYRLEPYLQFDFAFSDRLLAECMTKKFTDHRYDSKTSVELCRNIAADVRDRLYKSLFDRVKYVVIISIVEKADQSIISMHGRLWDTGKDTYSTYVFEASTFYACGMIVALYYE